MSDARQAPEGGLIPSLVIAKNCLVSQNYRIHICLPSLRRQSDAELGSPPDDVFRNPLGTVPDHFEKDDGINILSPPSSGSAGAKDFGSPIQVCTEIRDRWQKKHEPEE
ncbi:hypothetical protein VNI00_018582, partial [Paramarasmius palmivorus]